MGMPSSKHLDANMPHIPKFYVAGVFSHATETWMGEFIATSQELFEFGCNPNLDDAQAEVVGMMVECQQVYEEWWIRMTKLQKLYKKNQQK